MLNKENVNMEITLQRLDGYASPMCLVHLHCLVIITAKFHFTEGKGYSTSYILDVQNSVSSREYGPVLIFLEVG